MRRKLFTLAAAMSAVLCVGVCVLWVRSYIATDQLFWQGWEDEDDRSYWRQDAILSGRGGVGMNRIVQSGPRDSYRRASDQMLARHDPVRFHRTEPAAYPQFHVGVGDEPVWGGFKRGGFAHLEAGHSRPMAYGWQVVAPYWALLAATAVLPLAWGWRWRRRRRLVAIGHCDSCGYDLRATPDRCPECGAVPAAKGEQA
jgi:hypothetical protein